MTMIPPTVKSTDRSKTSSRIWARGKVWAGDRFLLLLIALGILAALLILLRQLNYGPGLHGDSLAYLSAARNLAAGNGLVTATGWPVTLYWPPLFPFLVGLPGFLGLDAIPAASLLNAAALGALVGIVGWWVRYSCGSTTLALWAALAVMLSGPLTTQIQSRALSEPVFILLTTLALIAAARFRDSGRRSALLWAAVFTALACLTRYMGVAILLTVLLLLLFTDQRRLEKAQNMAWYSLIAVAPPAAVLLLNQLFIGTFNSNPPSETTPPAILSSMAEALASWLLPVPGSWLNDNVMLAAPLGLLTLAPVAIVGVMAVRRWRVPGRWRSDLVVPAAFTLLYLALLLTAATVSRLVGLPERYLSPVYVPLLFIVAGLAAYWLRRNASPALRTQRARTARRLAPPLLLFLWLAYPVAATVVDINRALADGTGRQYDPRWVNSALIQYIAHHLDGIDYNRLYSNDEHIPYFHAGVPTRLLPINRNELRQVYHNRTAAAGVYVVWLENVHSHPRDYGRNELEESLPYPQLLFEDNDGALFYVSPASIAESIAAVARATAAAIYADAQQLDGPAISAAYDVYIADDRLIYIKEPCAVADTAETFYLHLHPAPADRPKPDEPIPQYGYHNLDFEFDRYGLKVGDRCTISVPYPGYEIARIRTGQYTAAGPVWESGVDFRLSAFQQMQLNDLAARQPVSRQRFAVYLLDGELAYLKEPCAPADTAAPFYLHIVPANSDALPAAQREYGYDNRDFTFDAAGWSFEGQCLATAPLPEYDIARIRTGQYTAAGRLWESEFAVGDR